MYTVEREYSTVRRVSGPLMFVEAVKGVGFGEVARIITPEGEERRGQVLEVTGNVAVIQVFEGTSGLDASHTKVRFSGETIKLPVSSDMLGRIFDGSGRPIDGGPRIIPEDYLDVNGAPINPPSREHPREFIQTGISSIDGMNTLVRGQKLPLYSGAGLPHNTVAAQIARQAKVRATGESFTTIFASMGITADEARYFIDDFERRGAFEHVTMFLNLAEDPVIERLLTPKIALTLAEFLGLRDGHARLGNSDRYDQLCRGLKRNLSSQRRSAWKARIPRLHVHRPCDHIRKSGQDPREKRIRHANADVNNAA